MTKIYSKTAYTLIELIVSMMLVSIVVLGIISINLVLSNNGQDYGQRYLVKSETQLTLNHILNDASLALGSGLCVTTGVTSSPPCVAPAVADTGILTQTTAPALPVNEFCIHQNPGSDDDTAGIWKCYTFNPVAFQITYCNKAYNLGDATGYRGANGACIAASTQFVGTAFSISNPAPPSFAATAAQMQFTMTLQNCLTNTAASCNNTGTSTDPANNPESQVSGSAYPQQEGTG